MAAFTEGAHTYRMLIDGQMPVNAVPPGLRLDRAILGTTLLLLIATTARPPAACAIIPPPPG